MSRSVAFIRGINVGRNKQVAMSDLQGLLEDLGATRVVTHLRSGNAVFDDPSGGPLTPAAVEEALVARTGVSARVVLRRAVDLARALRDDPLVEVVTDPARHLIAVLSARPQTGLDGLEAPIDPSGADQARLVGDHLYLWCPQGISNSEAGKVNWDRRLGVVVTARNQTTMTKLLQLAES
jgi:uncharacterized protein (DUF1697 family)